MRLIEFLTITKGEPTGTFIGVCPTQKTCLALIDWMRDNGITDPVDAKDLHCTLLLDKEKSIPWSNREYSPTLVINPHTYQLDEMGGALVLIFDSPELQERHQWGREEYCIDWKYPEYITHVTLSYRPNKSACDLTPPAFPLEFSHEFHQIHGADGPNVVTIEAADG